MVVLKILKFTFYIVVLGLIQVWAVLTILIFKEVEFDLSVILQDGGVFFFSTSLCFSSLYNLLEHKSSSQMIHNLYRSELISIAAALCVVIVCFISFIGYSIVFSEALENSIRPLYNGIYLKAQVVCAITAILFSFLVAAVTGKFLLQNDRGSQ